MNTLERCRLAIGYLTNSMGVTQKEVGIKLGYNNESYFSQVLNGKTGNIKRLIDRIHDLNKNINKEWLTDGTGNMLLSDNRAMKNSTIVGQNIMGNGNNIQHNDASISDLLKIHMDYIEMIKQKDIQINQLIEILSKK